MASSIENVEKEADKVFHKFVELKNHGERTLIDLIQKIENYQRDLSILTCMYQSLFMRLFCD